MKEIRTFEKATKRRQETLRTQESILHFSGHTKLPKKNLATTLLILTRSFGITTSKKLQTA